jgi:hypothetical protein
MIRSHPVTSSAFLNVDLEIRSRAKLDALADALSDAVFVLYSGPAESRTHLLNLELSRDSPRRSRTPAACIAAFCDLIENLPPVPRRLWDRAFRKSFDIGWQRAAPERSSTFALEPAILQRIAKLGASLAVTLYHDRKRVTGKRGRPRP